MGRPTLNIGTIAGGLNTNSVPDRCEVTLDLRSVPGAIMRGWLRRCAPACPRQRAASYRWTCPGLDRSGRALAGGAHDESAARSGQSVAPSAMSYFTDASIFTPALAGVQTVILGPGRAELAHKTDEYVSLARLEEAVAIYRDALDDWEG
ncbi:MAG: M20/M25/M40 family metallo-hydrolase [Paracoccaceae bacterium]